MPSLTAPRYYEGRNAYEMFGWKGTPLPPAPASAPDDTAEDDAPACRECGDYLEGDKLTGAYCPTCDGSTSWRYA